MSHVYTETDVLTWIAGYIEKIAVDAAAEEERTKRLQRCSQKFQSETAAETETEAFLVEEFGVLMDDPEESPVPRTPAQKRKSKCPGAPRKRVAARQHGSKVPVPVPSGLFRNRPNERA